jgi:Cu-Zn family superoxide dismutase
MRLPAILLLSAPLALVSCSISVDKSGHDHHASKRSSGKSAYATIQGRSGDALSGEAVFAERSGGVQVTITLEGATRGWHAVHVHEHGDCSAADFTSAGGHFNPDGHDHGAPHAMEHHAGDLGNLWVRDDGTGYHVVFMPELTVADGPRSVRGRSIIVHEHADVLVSQQTGAAGGRIGCGEIH